MGVTTPIRAAHVSKRVCPASRRATMFSLNRAVPFPALNCVERYLVQVGGGHPNSAAAPRHLCPPLVLGLGHRFDDLAIEGHQRFERRPVIRAWVRANKRGTDRTVVFHAAEEALLIPR